jgi:poly(3-hydroxybutyrate) depolymerase
MKPLQIFLLLAAAMPATSATQPFYDRKHFSKVLGEERNYRILLPPDYESSGRRYPVIYYFHGHSDRYTPTPFPRWRISWRITTRSWCRWTAT